MFQTTVNTISDTKTIQNNNPDLPIIFMDTVTNK